MIHIRIFYALYAPMHAYAPSIVLFFVHFKFLSFLHFLFYFALSFEFHTPHATSCDTFDSYG